MSSLPIEVWFFIFKYLGFIDLIEALRMECNYFKLWRIISKLKETNDIFHDRDWLLKSYKKNFNHFRNEIYW